MKSIKSLSLLMTVGACLSSNVLHATAPPLLSYSFAQDGYSEGAKVTGTFSGIDLDGNGLLVHFPPAGGPPIEHLELTSFSMHFSGNSHSPAFDLSLGELYGFVYQLGTSGIGDDPAFDPTLNQNLIEGIGAIGAAHFYTSGLGPNGFVGGYVGGHLDLNLPNTPASQALDSSTHLALVTPVSEPAGIGMFVAASLALAAGRRGGSAQLCAT